jgi:hypothetical protein
VPDNAKRLGAIEIGDLCFVGHDGQFVQGRLTVEQYDVSIDQMSLHDVANLQLLCNGFAVTVLEEPLETVRLFCNTFPIQNNGTTKNSLV